jgi:NTP pyrophosphatase (non-canonical NTP hydrolase)
MNDMFTDHLDDELGMLFELFDRRWPKYKDSWKGMSFHELVQRLVSEDQEHKGELTEFMEAIDSGDWMRIRNEALDSILVLFFLVQHANDRVVENWAEFKWCPHCRGGRLSKRKKALTHDYLCLQCDRGFRIEEDGSWQALFCADRSKYTRKSVVQAQEFWEREAQTGVRGVADVVYEPDLSKTPEEILEDEKE